LDRKGRKEGRKEGKRKGRKEEKKEGRKEGNLFYFLNKIYAWSSSLLDYV
jgi:predicted transposase YdaD